jgi:hypothetical protein
MKSRLVVLLIFVLWLQAAYALSMQANPLQVPGSLAISPAAVQPYVLTYHESR